MNQKYDEYNNKSMSTFTPYGQPINDADSMNILVQLYRNLFNGDSNNENDENVTQNMDISNGDAHVNIDQRTNDSVRGPVLTRHYTIPIPNLRNTIRPLDGIADTNKQLTQMNNRLKDLEQCIIAIMSWMDNDMNGAVTDRVTQLFTTVNDMYNRIHEWRTRLASKLEHPV